MERLGRREFFHRVGRAAGFTLAFHLFPHILLSSELEEGNKTFTIFGLHGVPNSTGEIDTDLLIADLVELSAKWFVSTWPREELVKRLRMAGIQPIIRLSEEGNTFDPALHASALGMITRYYDSPIIQPFNEVNLLRETRGVELPAREHIRQGFMPAAELIAGHGGITLLTPLAQDVIPPNLSEEPYFVEMLDELRNVVDNEWIKQHIAIAVHNYTFAPGADPWARTMRLNEITAEVLGEELPLYVTEAGLHRTETDGLDERTVAEDTIRILELPVPADVPAQALCFWVLSNFAQRPAEQQRSQNRDLRHFEAAAWRGLAGPREIFKAVSRYARSENRRAEP